MAAGPRAGEWVVSPEPTWYGSLAGGGAREEPKSLARDAF